MERPQDERSMAQIEYFLHQSTQGLHFIFERSEILDVLGQPGSDPSLMSSETLEKMRGMLRTFLVRPTLNEKRRFLEKLSAEEQNLLVRAYFHLVESTILAKSKHRH